MSKSDAKTFRTQDEAAAAAGKKKVFRVTLGKETVYAVASNALRAAGAAWIAAGGSVEQVGKPAKQLTAAEVLAALIALPESERKELAPHLKSLTNGNGHAKK